MPFLLAFHGGLHNFFSIWILCLLQVVPFILAYVLGSSLMEIDGGAWKDKFKETVIVLACCLFGFGFFYCALGVSTSRIAYVLFRYQTILLQIGGAILFLYSFCFFGVLEIPGACRNFMRVGGSFLVGSILGLAYQPCITPALSGIYNSVKDPATFSTGLLSLTFYALGLV